ncbi:hypothetical protein BU23DRAFT_479364 [Bimuria novae-zelandiae CBS 107.79]|uniref:HypA-like protein n=1 Tax=Bimuria novae-zelandiae CBS 107.79 TaxID=1447943 RepID=A0A6A5UWF0_9PLEO|nr:hypothetical protein BU23DRAFT_479364 [Bimuria novae-zelandiae CBS 107.79]
MATASTVNLDTELQPEYSVKGLSDEGAKVTSELLQENHDKHHIFFNQNGFHNHIVHHLLTLFALKASPEEIKRGYKDNVYYQRPPVALKKEIVDDMHNPDRFKIYLGKEKYYHDFLKYFEDEISKKGWENVVNDELFKGDERADDMLARLFAGFLHPIIHLGFGIEFRQPAIIAEALAQAAVHDNWMAPLFLEAEKAAKTNGAKPQDTKSIVQLLDEIRADKKLASSAHWSDGNKIRDGIMKRAPDEMLKYASQYVISEGQLEEKTAEMINAAVYYTAAAQHPPHIPKFDFFYMHCVNCSIFFSTFLSLPSLTPATKVRLLEWKVRNDLAMYASRGSPALMLDEITNYQPSSGRNSSWDEVIKRVNAHSDDGHASKLVRALAHGEQACKKYEDNDGFVVKGDMWEKLGNMAIDSVEAPGPTWVRSCGFDEAWKDIPKRTSGKLSRV